jgi:hypothetical protein
LLSSSTFLDFCVKVRTDDTSVLPVPGKPFKIRHLSEKEDALGATLGWNSLMLSWKTTASYT